MFRGKNPKFPEIRKNSIIFSSTQPKEEFPCTFCVGFPESARKQDFHLDDAKRSREKNSWHGKGADLMFQKDNQQSGWYFYETNTTVHLELFSDEGQLVSGQGRSTESVVQVCPSQT